MNKKQDVYSKFNNKYLRNLMKNQSIETQTFKIE